MTDPLNNIIQSLDEEMQNSKSRTESRKMWKTLSTPYVKPDPTIKQLLEMIRTWPPASNNEKK